MEKSYCMYIFDGRDHMVALQDMAGYTVADVEQMEKSVTHDSTRHVAVSDKGRAVCSYCRLDLGEKEIPAGELSHGVCPECLIIETQKFCKQEESYDKI